MTRHDQFAHPAPAVVLIPKPFANCTQTFGAIGQERVCQACKAKHAAAKHARRHAKRNGTGLPAPREIQIITLLRLGMRNKQIAAEVGISEGTAKVYISRMLRKFKVEDRHALGRVPIV